MRYIFIETEKANPEYMVIFGPWKKYEDAKDWAYGRIQMAIDEDWGLGVNKLSTEIYNWEIRVINK